MKNEKIIKANCASCGKAKLSKDEIGINMKLISEDVTSFHCLDCLVIYLDVSVQDIIDKIEDFKDEGCTLFK